MTMTITHPLIEVRAYRNAKEFERDGQRRMAAGWMLQGQSGDSGHVGFGGAAAGYLVAGVPGMIGLAGMRKGKTVVTWIHPSPTAVQIKACEARRRGNSTAANIWAFILLASLIAGVAFPPLLIMTVVAFCILVGISSRDNSIKQHY